MNNSMHKVFAAMTALLFCLAVGAGWTESAHGGWADSLKGIGGKILGTQDKSQTTQETSSAAASEPSVGEMNGGIKEALSQAVTAAVASLGRENGFLANPLVKIAMPEKLQQAEALLRKLGQDKLADQFIESMNRAAEQAVPKTAAIFGEAIRSMTVEEAAAILKGPENAATQYFESKTRENLAGEIQPVVHEATDAVMVTNYYKAMMAKAGPALPLFGDFTPDLDQYVTGKTLDGLFVVMAQEEKKIRENPAARTTELVKKVFDYFSGR